MGDLQTVRRSPARVTIRSITRFQVPTPAHCTSSRPCCVWAGRMSHWPQKRHLMHVLTVHGSLAERSGGSHLSLSPHLLPRRYGIKPWHRRLLGCRAARPSPRLMIHVEISVCNAVWSQYLGSFLSRLSHHRRQPRQCRTTLSTTTRQKLFRFWWRLCPCFWYASVPQS